MTVLPDIQLMLRLGAVAMQGDRDPVPLPAAELAAGSGFRGHWFVGGYGASIT